MREYTSWIEFQTTTGVKIQNRITEILEAQGLAVSYTLDDLVAAEIQARREILPVGEVR